NYPWASLKAEFVRWRRRNSRTADQCEADLEQFEKYCPVRSVRQLDHAYVEGFRDHRISQGVTPRTVNKHVDTLRAMLNKGVFWKKIGSNPIAGIKRLPHDKPKKERRALTVEEVEALFAASSDRMRVIWRAFMCTGLRLRELVNLTFDDFDEERRTLTVR